MSMHREAILMIMNQLMIYQSPHRNHYYFFQYTLLESWTTQQDFLSSMILKNINLKNNDLIKYKIP